MKKVKAANVVIYIILTVLAIIWLIPIFFLLVHSLRGEPGAAIKYIFPKNYTLDNYTRLFTDRELFDFPRWYLNTLIVSVCSCILSTIYVLMISYALSRLRFKGRGGYMKAGLILNMFPGFMSMIAVYFILKAVGLTQSLLALILVYSGTSALTYYIAKGFFDTIPMALDEAARIDGASKATIFWKITLPLSKPIIVYTVLMAFMSPWMDYIFASVIMKDNYKNYTVALGLFQMITRENIYDYFTMFCAGAVLVALPIALLFLFMQRYYVEGVTGGAVKG
ncbi:MAG: sugar ABC transporter permease [Clostridiales bacterium]|nr:sugar ABC transporter permease [Clostridiales bacterium]